MGCKLFVEVVSERANRSYIHRGCSTFKSVARLVFQGWQIVLEESGGSESEGLFHSVRYQNQIYMQEKIELSSMSQRPRVNSTKILGDLSVATKKKQQ